jgi:replicative DNA helicase
LQNKLTGSLQENILSLLCFDTESAMTIRGVITPELFESHVYRDIATRAVSHMEQFNSCPGNHLPDIFESILEGDNDEKADLYGQAITNLFDTKDDINNEYVMSQLNKFVRQQRMKSAVTASVKLIGDGLIDEAETELANCLGHQIDVFEPGLDFGDPKQSITSIASQDREFKLGIPELDDFGVTPARKELFMWMSPPNRGKTWALCHAGKHALMARKRVLHVTLEMTEERVAQRYHQMLFAVSTDRKGAAQRSVFNRDELGRFLSVDTEQFHRPSWYDADINQILKKKLGNFRKGHNLKIKNFPTNKLTMGMLESYLDGLERYQKFVPDLLVLDYAALMKKNAASVREDLGLIYENLRGLGGERNMAIASAVQGNRGTENNPKIGLGDVAADYSVGMTADVAVTINQTEKEESHNMMRLFVAKNRNDKKFMTVLVSNAFSHGQFVGDSILMQGSPKRYESELEAM